MNVGDRVRVVSGRKAMQTGSIVALVDGQYRISFTLGDDVLANADELELLPVVPVVGGGQTVWV